MAAISINDNLMMVIALYVWLTVMIKDLTWKVWQCKIVGPLVFLDLQNATYQVLAMTIDKYVAIKWPHKATIYSTPRRARLIVFGIYVWVLTYNAPHLYMSTVIGGQCVGYANGGSFAKVYTWLTFAVNAIIPFTMLIYMNIIIIKK